MNVLLQSLSPATHKLLIEKSESVHLSSGQVLAAAGLKPEWGYFITEGLASTVANLSGGRCVEVQSIGREGLVGASHLLGALPDTTSCLMCTSGYAREIQMTELAAIFKTSDSFRSRVLAYSQFSSYTISLVAGCNTAHKLDQRLARWLLMAHQRLQVDTIPLTHDEIARILSVQRPSLSLAAQKLKQNQAITYSFGLLKILDKEKLQRAACSCAEVCKDLFKSLVEGVENSTHMDSSANA